MSRYIDADHLRKWILSWWERTEPTSEYLEGGDILNQIDREPSVEIIRCRECKYTDGEPPIADGRSWCNLHGSFMYYCSDGEREGE